ncbi:Rid family detoxifying hydrolase [Conexibacter arvalis]|uniref:2-iminobutanoate/2-iminopropanoate deaminase n=1 Tax=Conexibacter arvalis TaxID=912552 RepID=A0A840IFL9_9ACTN|nr:Rid family detoxifying hydrolase [Conexibacter arvalis]MBB4663619.1 2-iminobutanoate/2-iminopropanoate deaminase [Conexibacter arvalis]
MSDRRAINSPAAPAAIGPYVHAVATGNLLFVSGQIPLDAESGELVGTTPAEQADKALQNLKAVIEEAGATLADVVRATVYMTDLGAFAEVNEVYARYFPNDPPARAAIGVAALPLGSQVEVDAIVVLPA